MFVVIRRLVGRQSLARLIAGGVLFIAAIGAQATPFELVYTGTFNTTEALNLASDANPTYFSGTTGFTVRALFDDSTPNLAPAFGGPFAGFRAYAPSLATIEIEPPEPVRVPPPIPKPVQPPDYSPFKNFEPTVGPGEDESVVVPPGFFEGPDGGLGPKRGGEVPFDGGSDRAVDLRVDDHEDPLKELARILAKRLPKK